MKTEYRTANERNVPSGFFHHRVRESRCLGVSPTFFDPFLISCPLQLVHTRTRRLVAARRDSKRVFRVGGEGHPASPLRPLSYGQRRRPNGVRPLSGEEPMPRDASASTRWTGPKDLFPACTVAFGGNSHSRRHVIGGPRD